MSRVITEGGVFTRRHHVELRRRVLRDALLNCCTSALPGLLTLGVEVEKYYEGESHTFDLAIFDLADLRWWVGRTLATVDDLEFEILLPTHALRRTQYLTDDGAEIAEQAPDDCRDLVASTVVEAVPGVVTFVSNPLPEWYQRVAEFEGQLAVLESFRGPGNTTLLRVNGQLPKARGVLIGSCEPMSESAGLIRVAGASKHWSKELATLEYYGDTVGVSGRVVGEDLVIRLEPRLIVPNAGASLTLWRLGDSHLELREGTDV
jgi:hypothetical protein